MFNLGKHTSHSLGFLNEVYFKGSTSYMYKIMIHSHFRTTNWTN
jgi:hypothetical protein